MHIQKAGSGVMPEAFLNRKGNEHNMEKQVLVHVSGLHMMEGDGQEEPVEFVVPGEHYFRNGSHYVRYEEMLDDSNKPTVNYIKISPKGMEVRKKGLVNTHMVFEQGKKNVAFYTTPFGTLQMGIAATNLEFKEKEGCLDMKVDYALEMNEGYVADCCLSILVEEKNDHFAL